jgi:hypothetical protein
VCQLQDKKISISYYSRFKNLNIVSILVINLKFKLICNLLQYFCVFNYDNDEIFQTLVKFVMKPFFRKLNLWLIDDPNQLSIFEDIHQ